MDRRSFLSGTFGLAALNPTARADEPAPMLLRGSIDANQTGLVPNSPEDQGRMMQGLLRQAAQTGLPLILQPGRYVISNLVLPARARIVGTPGATRLVFAGDGHMIAAANGERIELAGLIIDGDGKALADYVPGLIHIAGAKTVVIEDCTITGSTKSGVAIDRSGGRVERCTITAIAETGIRAVETDALSIAGNTITDCGDCGILVQRWTEGTDSALVTGNRIERVAARSTEDGQPGNGIRIFRAHGVVVVNNRLSECAAAAIRAGASRNLQIIGNSCFRSGEAGILAEFGCDGAILANNIVDGAATGISLAPATDGGRVAAISGNIVRNLTEGKTSEPHAGAGIAVGTAAAVSGNVIEGAPRYGLLIGWGSDLEDVAATGNIIRAAPVGIGVSVVEGAGSAIVSDNIIAGASRGSVVALRWSDAASGDLALSGAERYPQLSIERNRVS
jgi:uncharacterized secreted repeat protein (TIGR03808 family)